MASKRRAHLYTLTIIIGIGFLLGAGLAAWRRADLIATLSDQIAHGEKTQAPAAVSQLAAISNPPLSILVESATCDHSATVEAAQVAINKLLDDWQQQVDNHERMTRVADQVSQLSAAIAEQRRAFPPSSYPWLSSVAHKMVRVAEKCPPKTTALLALHCDEIMTLVGNSSYTTAATPPHSPETQNRSSAAFTDTSSGRIADRNQLEQTFTSFPSSSANDSVTPLPPARFGENVADRATRVQTPENPLRHDSIPVDQSDASQLPDADEDQASANSSPDDPNHPVLRNSEDSRSASAVTSNAHASFSPSGTYSTRELLERWRTTGGDEHRDVESQLAARGFKHLSPALVQQYLSTDDDRSHVVDTVLKLPGAEVRPWLFLLADDEDADVRLLAVTVMATSDDRGLIEKAWQISIRDQDPRIADLSAHLRERRAGTRLR